MKWVTESRRFVAGDTYCSTDSGTLFQQWLAGTIEFTAGPISDVVRNLILADFAGLATGGSHLPSYVQKAMTDLNAAGGGVFERSDVAKVLIVSEHYSHAGRFLANDSMQMETLGEVEMPGTPSGVVIVVRDWAYHALLDPQPAYTWNDLQWGRGPDDRFRALSVLAHEMVHVRQIRRLGQDAYAINNFIQNSINGYDRNAYEDEAYTANARLAQAVGGGFCERTAASQQSLIASRGLPVVWKPCRMYPPKAAALMSALRPLLD